MSLRVVTQEKNPVDYRYGQLFTYDNAKVAWRRQAFAHKLVVGVVDDAIGKGFNIIDSKTKKIIKNNTEAQEIIATMWTDLKKTMYYDRAYGKSLGMFFLPAGANIPIWRAYDIRNYYASYDKFAIPTMYHITNSVGGTDAQSETMEVIDGDLDFAYEIITREDDEKGEGLSVLEPVWDTLFALSSLDENATYYAIRYGAGIRYMKIPQSKFTDTAFMSKVMAMLKGAIGANGVYALPYATVAGVKEEFDIASESAVQIDFLSLQRLFLGSLSAQTGIPLEVWLGALLGLRSSEKNEDRYFDYLQSIQDDYRKFLKWIVYKLNTLFKWFEEALIIGIEFIGRDTMSKDEMITFIGKKLDIATKAGYTIPKNWLAGVLEIPLEEKELDPLGINKDVNDDTDDEADPDDSDKDDDESDEKED